MLTGTKWAASEPALKPLSDSTHFIFTCDHKAPDWGLTLSVPDLPTMCVRQLVKGFTQNNPNSVYVYVYIYKFCTKWIHLPLLNFSLIYL